MEQMITVSLNHSEFKIKVILVNNKSYRYDIDAA